jgi:hypothetical protein
VSRTNAHVPQPAVGDVSEYPLPTAALCHSQIELAAIGVHAGLLRPRDLECRESIECPCHCPRPAGVITLAHIRDADINRRSRTCLDGCGKVIPCLGPYMSPTRTAADACGHEMLGYPLRVAARAGPKGQSLRADFATGLQGVR